MSFPLSKFKIVEDQSFCIRASGSGITEIDQVNQNFSKTIKLYLSNNTIKSLENISQFNALEILMLSCNMISYIEDLRPLSNLKRLRILNLEENPVCRLPLYKVHILVLCPNLQEFDGKQVRDLICTKKYTQAQLKSMVSAESAILYSLIICEIVTKKLSNEIKQLQFN